MLSIIIPVYNGEKHLIHAIDSIIRQPINDIEILVIDDGSTDSTPQLCEKLQTKYPCVYIIRQHNQGASAARNTGLKNASGQYVLFLDSDDFIVDGVLDLELLEDMKQEKADVFMFSSLGANLKGTRFCIDQQYPNQMFTGRQIFPVSGTFAACLYKRQLLIDNDIWFDEGVSLNEDQVFKIKALYMAEKIRTFSKFLYVYCNNPKSIMHTIDKRMDRVTAWKCAYTWFDKHLAGQERERMLAYTQIKINSRTLLYAKNYIQSGHSEAELEDELKKQDSLTLLECLHPSQVMPYQIEELHLFQMDRKQFMRNARTENSKISVGRLALKIPFIRIMRERRKYPLTEIPKG